MTKLIIDFQGRISPSSVTVATLSQFTDYLEFERISFEWAMSYDFKDFDRLRKICAPEMEIDCKFFILLCVDQYSV